MTDCEEKEKKKGEGEDEDEYEDEVIDEMDKKFTDKGFEEIVPKAQNPTKPLRILNHPQNQSTLIICL